MSTNMKAVVYTEYGPPDVLRLAEVEIPVPKDDEVLIRVHATTVTTGDCEMRSLRLPLWLSLPLRLYFGLRRPRRMIIPGQELSGEIEQAGKNVREFEAGDQVFAATGFAFGACAGYVCLPAESQDGVIARKPANISHEQAAAVPTGGLEALHFLRKGNIQSGQKVLINGAGGSIGTAAVQLARYFGAEVTAVDSSGKLDMLRAIGASHVIDYTHEDFTRNGETYDVIFDVIGKSPFSASIRSLKQHGRYLLGNPGPSQMLRGPLASLTSGRRVISGTASRKTEDLVFLKDLVEVGRLKPVIDRRYPLEQTAEAHRYVETGQKKGNVVITVRQDGGGAN